jgi:putative membrane protein
MGPWLNDLLFAIGHHVLVFAIAGVLAFELGAVRVGLTGSEAARIARADRWYGILALGILLVGFARAAHAAKGWGYYSHNWVFWAKIGAFAVVGLISIMPTVRYMRWSRAAKADATYRPADEEVRSVRQFLWAEALVFMSIPIFAAAMARGAGFIPSG